MSDKRSKRRCVVRKTALPDAVHYVGYVEEDETPEMIMKKFEEMERIKAKNAGDPVYEEPVQGCQAPQPEVALNQEELDHAQLQEIFKATSMFSVKAVLGNNQALMGKPNHRDQGGSWSEGEVCSDREDDLIEELKGFWSEEDWDALRKQRHTRGRVPKERAPKEPKLRGRTAKSTIITQYNRDTNAFIRRRVRVVDPDAILQLRVPPPPLPLSWGRVVKPLQQQPPAAEVAASSSSSSSSCHQAADLTQFSYSSLQQQQPSQGGGFMGILINSGWETPAPAISSSSTAKQRITAVEGAAAAAVTEAAKAAAAAAGPGPSSRAQGSAASSARAAVEALNGRLGQLPLQQLCPKGFLFIWLHKEYVAGVVELMYNLGYSYVENLTWVLMHANNNILKVPHQYSRRSHMTLYIFRKEGEGRDIELRHQRSPDVVFDCVVTPDGSSWQTPPEVFQTIETLLPQGPGSFLEIWAPKGTSRPGWTHLVECEVES